jgi:hypothetical protein
MSDPASVAIWRVTVASALEEMPDRRSRGSWMLPNEMPRSPAASTESGSSACSRSSARAAAGDDASMMPLRLAPVRSAARYE